MFYTAVTMRVQQREFWVPAGPAPAPLTEREALTQVHLVPAVVKELRRQLYSPARARGGLLFGFQENETLHVVLASSAGAPDWYGGAGREILDVDARFALGWSEALFGLLGGRVDWVGNWIAYADGQLRSERRDLRRFKRGHRLGIFDDRTALVVVGWEDEALGYRAYAQGIGGEGEQVPCGSSEWTTRDVLATLFPGCEPS